ncbi:MAG: alpha/beta hydrolase [Marinovum sp.]|nr:alpha/beta hydrolase [Marinovum sp.]
MADTAPYFENMAQAPKGGACHWIEVDDGVRVRVGHWPLEGARGSVLIFPGRTEYVEKYGPTAQACHGLNLAAAAIDWRGQGIADRLHNDPRAGHVGDFDDYQRDVRAYLEHVRSLGMPEPYYMLAHSMGGCIGLRALYKGLPVDAVAFTAPMWGIGLHPVLRPTAWVVGWTSQQLGLAHLYAPSTGPESYVASAPYEDNTLTTDPTMFTFMKDQVTERPDLQLGGPSIHWLREALVECNTLARMPSPDLSCLTFLGRQERIVHPRRILDRMAAWPNGTLQMIENAEHEVLMERPAVRALIFEQLADHFQPAEPNAQKLTS